MYESIQKRLIKELDEVKISGRFKSERVIESTQKSEISVNNNKKLKNLVYLKMKELLNQNKPLKLELMVMMKY